MGINTDKKDLHKFKQVFLLVLQTVGAYPYVNKDFVIKTLFYIDFDFHIQYKTHVTGALYPSNMSGMDYYYPVGLSVIIEEMKCDEQIVEVDYSSTTKLLPLVNPDLKALNGQELLSIQNTLSQSRTLLNKTHRYIVNERYKSNEY